MLAQSRYISSIITSFSTFLETKSGNPEDKDHSVLVLLKVLEYKKDFSQWDSTLLEESLQKLHLVDIYSPAAISFVKEFIYKYPPYQTTVFLHEYLLALSVDGCSQSTIKNYRSDIDQYAYFAKETTLEAFLSKPKIIAFLKHEQLKGLRYASIYRKLVSLTQFAIWAESQTLVQNIVKELQHLKLTLEKELEPGSRQQVSSNEANTNSAPRSPTLTLKPNLSLKPPSDYSNKGARANQEYRSQLHDHLNALTRKISDRTPKFVVQYLNSALLIVLLLGVGYFGYVQLIKDAPQPFAYPSTPNRPARSLSFQGRLTDTAQNPITTATDMRFKLFDDPTAGTELWDSGTCSITPDQDGIFSTGLGDGGVPSDCGPEIDENVFSENASVYLEVTIEAETLDPRQPIKSVAYALNSETLQGYPIDATGSATKSTVVTMNEYGEVVLGEISPKLRSVSGTFTIEAQALTLQTTSGSNGNINLSPDGTGRVNINSDLALDGYLYAPGATLSATYAGGTALTLRAGPSATADIMQWQNSASSTLGVIDETGNVGVGTTAPATKLDAWGVIRASNSSSNYIQFSHDASNPYISFAGGNGLVLNSISGQKIVMPAENGTYSLGRDSLRWGSVWSNEYRAADGLAIGDSYFYTSIPSDGAIIEGNVGIGTSTVTQKLHISGNMRLTGAFYDGSNGAGTSGYVLSSTGTSTVWADPAILAGGTNLWDTSLGSLYPKNSTMDLLIGGTATTSAKFAFINVNSGTPTASISGNLALAVPTGSTPANKLNIYNGGSFGIRTSVGGDAGLNERFTILNNGNVGIASTSPGYKLDVTGDLRVTSTANFNAGVELGDTTGDLISFNGRVDTDIVPTTDGTYNLGTSALRWEELFVKGATIDIGDNGDSGLFGYNVASDYFSFDPDNDATAEFVMTDTGRFGIGTTSPIYPLHLKINQAAATVMNITNEDENGLEVISFTGDLNTWTLSHTNSAASDLGGADSFNIYSEANAPIVLWNSDTERMRIAADGNVGIGTDSPAYLLDVNGDIRAASGSDFYVGSIGLNDNGSTSSGASLVGLFDDSMAYISGNTNVQSAIKQLDTALGTVSGNNYWQRVAGNLSPLNVNDTISATTSAATALTITQTGAFNALLIEDQASDTSPFTINQAGNVGIGTTAASSLMQLGYNSGGLGSQTNFTLNGGSSNDITLSAQSQIATIKADASTGVFVGSTTGTTTLGFVGSSAGGATYINFSTNGGNTGLHVTHNSGSDLMTILSDGNVGIGDSTPTYKLDVAGTGRFTGAVDLDGDLELNSTLTDVNGAVGTSGQILSSTGTGVDWIDAPTGTIDGTGTANRVAYWTDSNTIAADDDFFFNGTNVGIGSTSPAAKLDVAGGTNISGNVGIGLITAPSSPMQMLTADKALRTYTSSSSNEGLLFDSYEINSVPYLRIADIVALGDTGGSNGGSAIRFITNNSDNASGVERMRIDKVGNVGIGTDTALTKLNITGSETNTQVGAGGTSSIRLQNTDQSGANRLSEIQFATAGSSNFAAISGSFVDGGGNTSGKLQFSTRGSTGDTNLTERLTILGGGNIGVGSTNPAAKLDVAGNGVFTGNISVGTTDQHAKLHLQGSESNTQVGAAAAAAIRLQNTDQSGAGRVAELQFSTAGNTKYAAISGAFNDGATNTTGHLYFSTRTSTADSNLTERMTILNTGNIGIATTAPTQKLDVNGTLRLRSNLYDENNSVGTPGQILSTTATGVDWIDASSGTIDGTGTANRVTYWTDSNTIAADDDLFFDGTNIGMGTTSPQGRLQINSAAVPIVFKESDQGAGSGLWRLVTDGDLMRFDKSLEASTDDFDTYASLFSMNESQVLLGGGGDTSTTMTVGANNGNVSIGSPGTNRKLAVAGGGYFNGLFDVESGSHTSSLVTINNGQTGATPTIPFSYTPTLTVAVSETSGSRPLFFGYDSGSSWNAILNAGACGAFTQMCLNMGTGSADYTALQNTQDGNLRVGGGDDGDFGHVLLRNSGNVGIGDETPTYKLDVNGTGRFTGAVDLDADLELNSTITDINGDVGTSGQILSSTSTGVDWINAPSGGSVAWNDLTDPSGNLALNMTTYTTAFNWDTGTSTNDLFSLTTDASSNGTGSLLNVQTGASSTVVPLRVRAGATEALYVTTAGNVGVGTTTASYKLDVNGTFRAASTSNAVFGNGSTGGVQLGDGTITKSSGALFSFDSGLSSGGVTLGNPLGSNPLGAGSVQLGSGAATANIGLDSAKDIAFYTGGAATGEIMRLQASAGNVGIGTTNPGNKLHIYGTNGEFGISMTNTDSSGDRSIFNALTTDAGSAYWGLTGNAGRILSPSGAGDLAFSNRTGGAIMFSADTSFTEAQLTILETGNVGINTATPTQKLDVNGTIRLRSNLYDENNSVGTPGQILSTTATGVDWIDAPAGGTNYWQRIAGNLSPVNLNDTISATTSAATALTITQTGAFNALLIEDQASDTSPFIIAQDGNVGIGSTAAGYKLDVTGDLRVTSTANFNAGVELGDATGDLISFNGRVDTSIVPNADGTVSLGSSTNRWDELFVKGSTIDIGDDGDSGLFGYNVASDYFSFDPDNDATAEFVMTDGGNFGIGSVTPGQALDVVGNMRGAMFIDSLGGGSYYLDPAAGSTSLSVAGNIGIGSTAPAFGIDVNSTARVSGAAQFDGNVTLGNATTDQVIFTGRVNSDILPISDGDFDLGSSALRWNSLYVKGASIHIGDAGNDASIEYNGSVLSFDPDSDATPEFSISDGGNIGIGTSTLTNELTVNGSGRFYGAYDQDSTAVGVHIGYLSSTPRVLFANGTQAQNWQIDNDGGDFRWYTPGTVQMRLSSSILTLPSKAIQVTGTANTNYFSGNMGIGTTGAGTARLFVDAGTDGKGIEIQDATSYGIDINSLVTNASGINITLTGGGTGIGANADSGIAASFSSTSGYALVTGSGNIGIGDSTPDYLFEVGGSGPSGVLALSDTTNVAHSVTTIAQTDVFGLYQANSGSSGGLRISGMSDNAGVTGLELAGYIGVSDPTDSVPAVRVNVARASGIGGGVSALNAAETAFQVANNGTGIFQLHANGNSIFTNSMMRTGGVNGLGDSFSMVPNNSFEIDNDGNSAADGWTNVTRTTSQISAGDYAGQIAAGATALSVCMPVSKSNAYQLRWNINYNTATTNTHAFYLRSYTSYSNCTGDSSGTDNTPASNHNTAHSTWTEEGATVTMGATATWARVKIVNSAVSDVMYVDSIKVTTGAITDAADLAEWTEYSGETPQVGQIMTLIGDKKVMLSQVEHEEGLAGVVSTNPHTVMGEQSPTSTALALAGRVPVIVTTKNGHIDSGDYITSSNYSGTGMKAKFAGQVIGKAMESTSDWVNCPAVPNSQNIPWPEDDGDNHNKPCFTLPNGDIIGKIMMLIDNSWYQGDLDLNGAGQIMITESNGTYEIPNLPTSTANKVAVFSQAIIAQMRAGLVNTKDLVVEETASIANLSVESLQINGQSLADYIASIVGQQPGNGQPLIADNAVDSLQMTDDTLEIENNDGETVASIDSSGNATFSGTTTLGTLLSTDASISGTLTTQELDASSARIGLLEGRVAELQSIKAQTAELMDATISGTLYANNIADFEAKVASAMNQPSLLAALLQQMPQNPSPPENVIPPVEGAGYNATGAAELNKSLADLNLGTEDVVLLPSAVFIDQYLKVNGIAYVADSLGVGNRILVGDGMSMGNGTIAYEPSTTDAPLFKIQPSGKGSLELMAGLMTLSEDGSVTIDGNVAVAGNLQVGETLLTDLLQPTDFNNPFQVQVAGISTESGQLKQSRFEIINENKVPVATISANGRAQFADGIGVGTENVSGGSTLQTSQTSGRATLSANNLEVTLLSNKITENSLVYITPVGSTNNTVLYVKSQSPDNLATPEQEGKFVVGFDEVLDRDIQFNWWIIN